ncbi:MAG: hypothetical protein U9R38_06860 [Candidatus Margulisiibacteriota bacterium]|nr:hypothetical protein [Candidatus Margulisiibacteriota bacterium]
MKRYLSVLLIVLFLMAGIGSLMLVPQARAQLVYLGMYWIAGEVEDPDGVGTDGRRVVFFKDPLVSNNIEGGYADDYVGPTGLAGVADRFVLNAFEDYRMPIVPGKYFAAIVNSDVDNYGANPVEVTVTGRGFDIAPNMVLELNAGPNSPSPRGGPEIDNIRFGNRKYQAELVAKGQEFIVSSQPKISADVRSAMGLDTSKIFMVVNEGTANAKTYTIATDAKVSVAAGTSTTPTEISFIRDFFNEGDSLPDGETTIAFKATNIYGSTVVDCTVTVVGGEARLIGVPLTYPSPLHLMQANSVIFQYTLSKDTPVDIFLFDVSGRIAKKITCYARDEGGSAGVNKVTWNLITDQGQKVASGIYVFSLVNRESGKLLGKGKFTALP